jgi:hypothetical protein
MKSFLHVLAALAVLGLAFWAYRENYATQSVLKEVRTLQHEIASLRDVLSVQRAEWAYLNRPDRLRDLATINFDRLGLLPLQPEQFGHPQDIGYPSANLAVLSETVDVQGETALQQGQVP